MFVKADSLPVMNTSFVGRERELAEIVGLLQMPHCRLLTLTGPGGSGKTRLALEAAGLLREHFDDGVAFVSLQPVSSPLFIAATIAEAVGLAVHGPREVQAQLLDYLRDRQLLLVLDNFEHLLETAALVSTMLAVAPRTKALVTSREVLNLQEEWVRTVSGLAFPAPGETGTAEELLSYGAVRLFSERAQQVQRTFSLADGQACVTHICRLVDGLPLALELAASWLRTLTCQEVAAEIERNLDFLETSQRNVPLRHQSMRAVFDQSWQLLTKREQETFARLSVFHGGCTRSAASAVAGASLATLQGLVDKSVLMVTADARYQSHELLRQFAAEKLAANPQTLEEARDQHMAHFAAFLHHHESRLRGPEQQGALQAIDGDLDNIRVAWMRAVRQRATDPIRQAMGALFFYYQMRSRLTEGLESFRAAATLPLSELGEPLLVRLQLLQTWFTAGVASTPESAVRFYRESFERLQPLGTDESMAMPLCVFAWAGDLLGDTVPMQRFYAANYAYHQGQGNQWGAAWAAYGLGTLLSRMYAETIPAGDLADSLMYLEESADLLRALGNSWAATYALHAAAHMLLDLGEYERAAEIFRESLEICRQAGDPGGVAFALHGLGEAASGLQEYEGSWRYLNDALQISYQQGSEMVYTHLYEMAAAFSAAGQPSRAVELMTFLLRESHKQWVRRSASQKLSALEEVLPEASFAAARRYGEQVDLGTLVQTLAAEFGVLDDGPSGATGVAPGGDAAPLVEALSPRELEVLQLVAAGLSNGEIASRLTVTVGTVKKHLNNVFGKLQVTSRTQAVARARSLSLIS